MGGIMIEKEQSPEVREYFFHVTHNGKFETIDKF